MKILGRKLRVLWAGDFDVLSSLAHVNRELCLGLIAARRRRIMHQRDERLTGRLKPSGRIHASRRCSPARATLSGPPDVQYATVFRRTGNR